MSTANVENTFTIHELLDKYKRHPNDSGSSEVQIIMWTYKITYLTRHLNEFTKDFSAKKAITAWVNMRRKALQYLEWENSEVCKKIVRDLDIRYRFVNKI